jgi:hypothetical protein
LSTPIRSLISSHNPQEISCPLRQRGLRSILQVGAGTRSFVLLPNSTFDFNGIFPSRWAMPSVLTRRLHDTVFDIPTFLFISPCPLSPTCKQSTLPPQSNFARSRGIKIELSTFSSTVLADSGGYFFGSHPARLVMIPHPRTSPSLFYSTTTCFLSRVVSQNGTNFP